MDRIKNDISEFVNSNYLDYKAIISNELFSESTPPHGFYESFILSIIPELSKAKNKDEIYSTIRIQLLNFFRVSELPSKEKIKKLSDRLFDHFYEANRDIRGEKLNQIHSILGLVLIIIDVLLFAVLELLRGDDGFSFGIVFQLLGITIWFLPSISGYLAYKRSKTSFFGIGHFLWMMFNLGLIFLLLRDFSHRIFFEAAP